MARIWEARGGLGFWGKRTWNNHWKHAHIVKLYGDAVGGGKEERVEDGGFIIWLGRGEEGKEDDEENDLN